LLWGRRFEPRAPVRRHPFGLIEPDVLLTPDQPVWEKLFPHFPNRTRGLPEKRREVEKSFSSVITARIGTV
jgi:hypothetical protein